MTEKPDPLRVVDTTDLTDADWAEINNLKKVYDTAGERALSAALKAVGERDPIRAARVLGAFFPDLVRETIKDRLADMGITGEDLRELIRKLENPNQSRHQGANASFADSNLWHHRVIRFHMFLRTARSRLTGLSNLASQPSAKAPSRGVDFRHRQR
jgi:hypothetical protein